MQGRLELPHLSIRIRRHPKLSEPTTGASPQQFTFTFGLVWQ